MNVLINNKISMTSRDIAELTGKRHDHVMRDIRLEIEALGEIDAPIFGAVDYKDKKGEKRPMYSFGKKGAMQLALKYDAVTRFKVIEKIEELESKLNRPTTLRESLLAQVKLIDENEKLQIENKAMTPKAEFFDAVTDSKTALEMGKIAKVLAIKGYGRNKLFAFLREAKILRHNNEPYQQYIDRGLFRIIEQKYKVPCGETRISIKTLVFQKGLDYILKAVNKHEDIKLQKWEEEMR